MTNFKANIPCDFKLF